jgi:type I restriction enzyme R subunit
VEKTKEFFLIFDICGNFEIFEDFQMDIILPQPKPLHQQFVEAQLDIVVSIQIIPTLQRMMMK